MYLFGSDPLRPSSRSLPLSLSRSVSLSGSLSHHLSPLILLNADGLSAKQCYRIDIVAAYTDNIHFSEISAGQKH